MFNSGRQGQTKIASAAILVLLIIWLYKLNVGSYVLPSRETTEEWEQKNIDIENPVAESTLDSTVEVTATSTPILDAVESSAATQSKESSGGETHEKTVIMGKTWKEDATWVKEKLPEYVIL